ncbi:hypothetical protein LTR35_007093 [Friedmanniomyces endolithicus]|uniref:DUF924-domain-containing protein n=1 Tax=Friedmanniomyces endolithicus TaxID=329885 RepID=A0AAN6FAM9_9PEZI|nr:hypothetical protein LTR35_007093 [Friedmanniomyces endolithicus]KAK0289983.1 hypothetical protein LTS00_008813 [Friedmanniomyces endolithicus]KAK0307027.1 hypothetical protein LTR82_016068 [Friedmanniomyces endolithicus]KAK1017269.1 hypothetical protein LTR54_002646 [Friedmanniomyces endolithicus]
MATPTSSFQLQRDVFNQSTYSQLRELWFRGQSESDAAPNSEALKRWFGVGNSPQEKEALDEECRAIAGSALSTISPSHLVLPPFTNYAADLKNADTIAAPFLDEVNRARQEDETEGAKTLLSLVLLLDQMPRNLFRRHEDLPIIYQHYDRLAWTLVRSTLASNQDLIEHPSLKSRTYWSWFLLPLMHSEDLPSHELAQQLESRWRERANEPSEGPVADFARNYAGSARQHVETIERFGRYPHRNGCLGRESTGEEERYLETADTFGVTQRAGSSVKDEL